MFTPIKNTTVSEKIVEQIKQMLLDGNLNKGDKLPSERQLAKNLQVSRSSVREALKELEIMGLIEIKQGGGNFIKENFEDILFEPFSTIFLIKESNAEETNSEEDLTELDIVFHYKIAQASKNFLLQSILNAVSSLIEPSINYIRKNILTEEEHREIIKRQHINIYNALKNKNPKAAEIAMSNHLCFINFEIKKSIK